MTNYKITLDETLLQGLFSQSKSLAKLLSQVLNPILEAEVSELLQAERYERNPFREGHRNGSRRRGLNTRAGRIELSVPQVRGISYRPTIFDRYQRSEEAFVSVLMEMVINGVSTRKVERITQELCGKAFKRSTVSELCKQLDPLVSAWRNRSLNTHDYPFVLVDAIVIRVRKDGRVRQQSLLIATGVNAIGVREILGFQLGDSESTKTWAEFFIALKHRGLQGVDVVVSDHHAGLVEAIRVHFQGATWQRCQTHFMRNLMDCCPTALTTTLRTKIREIWDADDQAKARALLRKLHDQFFTKAPKVIQKLEDGFDDAVANLALPKKYRRQIRTTNMVERLNREIRRREQVISIFPNEQSAERLIGAMLMELHQAYTRQPYFDMSEYWTTRKMIQ